MHAKLRMFFSSVPGSVSNILWDPRSDSSVVVSWSPPLRPNGIILQYTMILLQLNAVAGFADAQTVSSSALMVEFTSSELGKPMFCNWSAHW